MIIEGTSFRLRGSMGQDITGYTGLEFKYIRPDGTTGAWSATAEDEAVGSMSADVPANATMSKSGEWLVWGHASFSVTKDMKTPAEILIISPEGSKSS